MANELLDFVMSLVRDPDAAARYAENPQQAIADAHLTNVASADVNNLIPVVSESLSMASPVHGAGAAADGNVWSSGAATAAFDAFGDHPPAVDTHHASFDQVAVSAVDVPADQPHDPGPGLHAFDADPLDQPLTMDDVEVHDVPPLDPGFDHPGVDPVFDHAVDHQTDHSADPHGFDPHF